MPRLADRRRLFAATGQFPWMASHTALPIPFVLEGRVRVYFGARDKDNRPSIGYYDFDPAAPAQGELGGPCMGRGEPGHFDDNGVYPGTLLEDAGTLRMWYSGRSNGSAPLFYMGIGLAESADQGRTFKRTRLSPVLSRTEEGPWGASMPYVRREGAEYVMWYSSLIGWKPGMTGSFYDLRESRSRDGIIWQPPLPLVELQGGFTNLASPSSLWGKVLFSASRGEGDYRLAIAERGGRLELVDTGTDSWEGGQYAYPHAFMWQGRAYVLYAGGRFGAAGLGLAELEEK